jgi:siroheme synthase-like protein
VAGFFPMFVRLAGRIVVVVGGGDLAVRTVGPLLACDAEVRVISPHLAPGFSQFRGAPNLALIGRRLQNADLEDALLALAVDEDPSVNLATARQGLEWNVLVSVADELALSAVLRPPGRAHAGAARRDPQLGPEPSRRRGPRAGAQPRVR